MLCDIWAGMHTGSEICWSEIPQRMPLRFLTYALTFSQNLLWHFLWHVFAKCFRRLIRFLTNNCKKRSSSSNSFVPCFEEPEAVPQQKGWRWLSTSPIFGRGPKPYNLAVFHFAQTNIIDIAWTSSQCPNTRYPKDWRVSSSHKTITLQATRQIHMLHYSSPQNPMISQRTHSLVTRGTTVPPPHSCYRPISYWSYLQLLTLQTRAGDI